MNEFQFVVAGGKKLWSQIRHFPDNTPGFAGWMKHGGRAQFKVTFP